MTRPSIFVTQPIAESALARLQAVADVKVNKDSRRVLDKGKLIAAVAKHDILFSLLHDTVDRAVLAANPGLKAVASMAITPDRIDVATATARGILVTVIPPIVGEATADICFGLMIAVARRMMEGDRMVRAGEFPGAQSNHLAGAWVWGKTLGLVGGRGRIGQAVARRARGFSMRILYSGPHRMAETEERALGMTYVPFERLLRESDFVSLHPPLNAETHHMIGERELGLMKPSAFLINTARGAIVDEAALARALKARRIAGAGLDVFENEPRVSRSLVSNSTLVATPHLGSAVMELRETMANIVVDNILAIISGGRPPNCLNPETLDKRAPVASAAPERRRAAR
ncbi:MAG TPA: D-glycerate dehydrogenase [Xanthobacteraceae bacterium]|nr:D-glycerate dehydrogenase [Xanthobacteraceae bacterium]